MGEIAVKSSGVYLDRVIVVVDEDINPMDPHDILWAMSTRCEPSSGVTIYPNLPGTTLDPLVSPERATSGNYAHSKMAIDACKPFEWMDKFPRTNALSESTKKAISGKWLSLLLKS